METRQRLGPSPHVSRNSRTSSDPASQKLHGHVPAKYEHLVVKDSFFCPSGESPYKSSKLNSFSKDTSLMRTTDAFSCLISIRFSDHRKSNSLMRKLYYQLCGAVAKCLVLVINFLLPSPTPPPPPPISFVADIKHLLSLLIWHQMRKNCFHQKV